MSAEHDHDHDHDHEVAGDDVELRDEDVVEIVEDDGPAGEPMDDDDDLAGYDGEIVIGGPGPDDEDMEEVEQIEIEDNSWGGSCECDRTDSLHERAFADKQHQPRTSLDSPSLLFTCTRRSPTPL